MINDAALTPGSILVGLLTVGLVCNCTSSKSGGTLDASGAGGAVRTGGESATGGVSSGGATATGGSTARGGSSATGGLTSVGGAMVTGGSGATGGTISAGGVTVAGGKTASGGSSATGGVSSSGGVTAVGGNTSTGGIGGGSSDAGSVDARLLDASEGGRDAVAVDAQTGAADTARDTSTGKGDATAAVSFKTEILPMLKTNCTSCHGPTLQNNGVRVDTYANVSASLQAVTDVLVNGGMPPSGPLSDADRQLFQTWVDQGALNN